MGSFSTLALDHRALVIVVVLFGGRGKISELMGDLAKGIKTFKKGMARGRGQARRTPHDDRSRSGAPMSSPTAPSRRRKSAEQRLQRQGVS